jgi:predicted DNA-binding transcriptional regulator AlpA
MSLSRDEPTLPRLLIKKQVLAIVPLSFPTVWKLMRQGEFPAARVIGSRPYWPEDEIRQWVASLPVRKYKP